MTWTRKWTGTVEWTMGSLRNACIFLEVVGFKSHMLS